MKIIEQAPTNINDTEVTVVLTVKELRLLHAAVAASRSDDYRAGGVEPIDSRIEDPFDNDLPYCIYTDLVTLFRDNGWPLREKGVVPLGDDG